MEIELKYGVPDRETADMIWENELFKEYEEEGSREELFFDAKYFDTAECDLAGNEIAYRVRKESDSLVASLKWKGHSEDGLHVREEINVPVDCDKPNPSVFRESSVGTEVMEIIQDRELIYLMETVVKRRRFRIDTGTSLFEVSVDSGEIVTEFGRMPIDEVEIELFSGETDELLSTGRILQEKYNLKEENESKYSRGLKLIESNVNK